MNNTPFQEMIDGKRKATGSISLEKDKLMRIGDVARKASIGIETLRFYERLGLIEATRRTPSGYREYDQSVFERIDFIRKSQEIGFSLEEIKEIIGHKKAGRSPCSHVKDLVRRRLSELEQKIKSMQSSRKKLAKMLEDWEKIGESEGHVCGLIEKHSERM
jgi:DNA-binding transcriptional MerR regulator